MIFSREVLQSFMMEQVKILATLLWLSTPHASADWRRQVAQHYAPVDRLWVNDVELECNAACMGVVGPERRVAGRGKGCVDFAMAGVEPWC